ncbi:hypothetical protein [Catellatospora sichuanensis]|uniref:hypothetical protein n=1 Tax=Catellatospora sichuanensis TaxID=1969805 RepID=UPI0011836F85|nr:hypothetical protein [Catellatospora sichuanensis]
MQNATAQLTKARENMQLMLANGAPVEAREMQERLINRLKGKVAAELSPFYRTGKGSHAHRSDFCANYRRSVFTGDVFRIPAAEIAEWAPCLACCTAEDIAGWAKPTETAKAECKNSGVKNPKRIYSTCIDCGKEGKVKAGRIRKHAPAN